MNLTAARRVTPRRALWAAALVAAVVGATALQPTSSAATATAAPNNDPGFIQVYVNNVENLPTAGLQCHGDWRDLYYYMRLQKHRPDVYLVQQISNQKQLNELVDRMSRDLGERYAGVIAERDPKRMNSKCGAPKKYQTNAVIYRTARFSLRSDPDASSKRWQSLVDEGDGCVRNHQARTKNVKVRLHDKVADRDVTAASIHWATGRSGGGPACSRENAKEAVAEMRADGYGGDLLIFGGDGNVTDRGSGNDYRSWYRWLNGDLGGGGGYRDAVYDRCGGSKGCLDDNWTVRGPGNRIDFLFARKGNGAMPNVSAAHTITFNEGDRADDKLTGGDRADRDYSDHRALRAAIHY